MIETTDEFMVRFRATGLDMLCEARRRAKQAVPWYGVRTGRMSMKHPAFGWPYGLHRNVWKGAAVGKTYFDPESFFGRDFTALEDRVMQMHISTPEGPYRDPFRRLFQRDPAHWLIQSDTHGIDRMVRIDPDEWDRQVLTGRRVGQSMQKLSAAFALSAEAFGNWDFTEPVPEPHEPQDRTLWPGVKAQVEGERRVNVKRVAKDRLKKKLAKKRK